MTAPVPALEGPHFFVDPADVDHGIALLRGDEARHLVVVLRTRAGAPVSLADGTGRRWQARLASPDASEARLVLLHEVPEEPERPHVAVVQALPKGRKLDEVVQRLAEVGVTRLVPVTSARSEVRLTGARQERTLARWRAVALAASKQSRRARALEVAPIGAWPGPLATAPGAVVLWEEATVGLRRVLEGLGDVEEILLGVGPEGGLTRAEAAAGQGPPALLGPTVLRTETAALVAASAVLTLSGRIA